ncbi:hypothetical protein LUZ60_002351 [Juncus effusus]|nr:hypothetical protein LUZ60_002351 [Juncus effusus]
MVACRNLTSSGLKGEISQSFKSFQAVENLDLSFNNLTGPVPEFLANMGSLVYLNLAGNNFTGLIPDNLIKKSQNGFLTLILESDEFRSGSHRNNKKKIIVIASVASAILLAIMILVVWKICRKKQALRADNQLHVDFRLFTHEQLKQITNNFSEAIGRGGFGTVYSGLIDEGTKVAVKVPNIGTATAMRQFLSEAKSLTQVHHRNLVTLIGYCMDKNFYGLVYEYMPNGSLYDHLASNTRICRVLNWAERLRIAFEAAQGLDYLHTGCMIAHRDVKSSNILLGPNFEAKIADFGLAKMFNAITGVSTISLCGTPGYIDPEVRVAPLSERSDVYSFGVVLMEIITGEPPIMPGRENVNLIKHVKQSISTGSIDEIMDSRLPSSYTEKILWKVIDLAIRCTEETSEGRPIMAELVTELRDCLSEESRWANRDMNIEEGVKSQASPINSYLVEMGPSVR